VKDREMIFEIGESPIYLIKEGSKSFKELVAMLSSGKCYISPVEVALNIARIDKGTILLRNLTRDGLTANVTFSGGGTAIKEKTKISKGATTPVELSLPDAFIESKEARINVDCGDALDKVAVSFPMAFEKCHKVGFPVKIDGDLSEWRDFPCISMNDRGQIMPPDPWVPWDGPQDLGAKVYVGWDAENFYLAAEVVDDKHFNNNAARDICNGDSVQFAFSPGMTVYSNAGISGYEVGDCELGMALAKEGVAVYQWYGPEKDLWKGSERAIIRDENRKTTTYETKIPLKYLHIPAEAKSVFGFNFVIFDDDSGTGGNYWYQLSAGITLPKNPRAFKRFVLTDGIAP